MPKRLSLRNCLYFFILLVLVCACRVDHKNADIPSVIPDFVVNDVDLELFGLDYAEKDLEIYMDDPSKVLRVEQGQVVTFTNTSENDTTSLVGQWLLDDQEWEKSKNKKVFSDTFNDLRFHKITLQYGEGSFINYASKIIKVEQRGKEPIPEDVVADNSIVKPDLFNNYGSNFDVKSMLNKIFESNLSSNQQEGILNTYMDSLNHFIDHSTIVVKDDIEADLIDLISIAIITNDKIFIEGDPIFKNNKLAYLAVSKK